MTPQYELFAGPKNMSWAEVFVRTLEPGVPTPIPQGKRLSWSGQGLVRSTAKRIGYPVTTRYVDGRPWACLLHPDDAQRLGL